VYLRADKGLDYGRVMRVMGELNRAGLNRVSLVTVEGGAR
jgi:biopolymer transport protein TolR